MPKKTKKINKNKKALVPAKHDALLKRIMQNQVAGREFLEYYLPQDLKSLLNLYTLQVEQESYVEESLKRQLSDIVYSLKTKNNEEAFIYVLLESQSSVDHYIAFRLWKYTLLLIERHIKDKKKLPLVVPIVLYHGKYKYTAARSLWNLFEEPKVAKQLMGNEYLLVDLQSMPDDDIKKKKHLGMVEYFLKHIHRRDMLQLWRQFFEDFQDVILIDKANNYIYIKSLLWYSDSKVENDKKEELTKLVLDNLPKDDGEKLMYSIADAYIDQGIEKGIEKGREEGIQIGIQTGIQAGIEKGMKKGMETAAINMLKSNLELKFISSVTGLSIDVLQKLKASLLY